MGGMFKTNVPDTPTPPAPTPAPTIDTARQSVQSRDNASMRAGRAAGILTSSKGDLSETKTASKMLLGG